MPDDAKKNQEKRKNDPKEQRKPRNARNQAGKQERRVEKVEESKSAPKVPQKPPVYEDPGPEFYKSLKRETEEILKITEEESSKYKKKEIQSNWSKYEMPIESYEEIEEHDVGADYEKLIQAPLSTGGHFQFKHEKSWDVSTGPSLYDKYFDIDMDNLSLAISSIPFYERYDIDQSIFSETDMNNMRNRATKYREKYNNNELTKKTHSATEIVSKVENEEAEIEAIQKENHLESIPKTNEGRSAESDDIDLDFNNLKNHLPSPITINSQVEIELRSNDNKALEINKILEDIDQPLKVLESEPPIKQNISQNISPPKEIIKDNVVTETPNEDVIKKPSEIAMANISRETETKLKTTTKPETVPKDEPVAKNPVIESPEDLEKWLDDFLDG